MHSSKEEHRSIETSSPVSTTFASVYAELSAPLLKPSHPLVQEVLKLAHGKYSQFVANTWYVEKEIERSQRSFWNWSDADIHTVSRVLYTSVLKSVISPGNCHRIAPRPNVRNSLDSYELPPKHSDLHFAQAIPAVSSQSLIR